MEILHVYAKNFCKFYGTNVLDADFSHKTELLGRNEVGKSTVKRVILDVLNCHDEKDREITGIRPHDENGKEIDDVDIVRAVTFDIDGKRKTLQKVTRQKRNKKGDITGTVTDYSINDVPYKMADYNEFINENIVDIVTLPYCLNAMTLLSKTPVEQRLALSDFFKTHTDDEICDMFPDFLELKSMLEDGNIDQIKKVCRGKLNGTGGRNGSKGLVKERDDISTKLDYIHSNSQYVDLAELELAKKDCEAKLTQINEKLADNEKLLEEHKKEADGILQLKFDLSDIEQKANADNERQKSELNAQIRDFEGKIAVLERNINASNRNKSALEISIKETKANIEKARVEWTKANELQFDESSTSCPMCGQKLPDSRIEELKADFAEKKKQNLNKITTKGNEIKTILENYKQSLNKTESDIATYTAQKKELEDKLSVVRQQYAKLPASIDMSTDEDYIKLQNTIAEKEKSLNEENSVSEIRKSLEADKNEIIQQKADIEAKISIGTENNKRIDDNIADLENERTDLNQQICDWERKLELLKEFTRKKNQLLQDDVNKYLDFCKASLFRPLINGDTEECCDFIYNGEAYARNLNHGARMLVEVDICRAFQKKAGVVFPIIVDDTESVDDWRIPQIENQMILLKHTQDKELEIVEG